MTPNECIQHFAQLHGLTRSDVWRTCRDLGMSRQSMHGYWHGLRRPDPLAASMLCVALDLDARQCCELYEACGIPTPDPVWEAVQEAARGFIGGEE